MKSSIWDKQVLAAVWPAEVASYLRTRGWARADYPDERAQLWLRGDAEVLLPVDAGLADYTLRIGEALQALERAEERPAKEIWEDLHGMAWDVIRFRFIAETVRDGTVPLEIGTGWAQQVRNLVQAAANTACWIAPIHPNRRPREVTQFLMQARLGLAEQQSYVLTVRSPIPPAVQLTLAFQDELEIPPSQPFERRVTETLAHLLNSAGRVATGMVDPNLDDALRAGLSANFCESLSALVYDQAEARLDISFAWSANREPPEVRSQASFRPEAAGPLKELARVLRLSEPRPNFELVGPILTLDRAKEETQGKVTVLGLIDGKPRRVELVLDTADYHRAIDVHRDRGWLECEGELHREGRTWRLRNVRSLKFHSSDED